MAAFLGCVVVFFLGGVGLVRLGRGDDLFPAPPAGARRRARLSAANARLAGIALLVAVCVSVVTRWPVAGVLSGAVVFWWPRIGRGGRIERTALAKLEALASWTESLRDAASSTAALETAIPATLAGVPQQLAFPLQTLVNRLEVKIPLPEALTLFAVDVEDGHAHMVVAPLALNARQRGGSLRRVLTTLAENTRAELEVQRKIMLERNALRRQSQQASALILLLAVGQAVLVPSWVAPYGTSVGQLLLGVLAGIYLLLLVRLQRLAAPEPQPRFLGTVEDVMDVASYPAQAIS